MSQIFETIKQKVAEAQADVTKFSQGNNAAGSRVRKAMQELKQLAQALRQEVLEAKNASKDGK
ncbi:MAG: histone H1 [Saprospiraceae bacterium]|nr:histone H1 [Saprospiraceae bacterium]